jgi:hypothetical protein
VSEPAQSNDAPYKPAGPGLVERRVLINRDQVAWLRYVIEAHEGLGFMHGDGTGAVYLFAPESQAGALDELIADLEREGTLRLF